MSEYARQLSRRIEAIDTAVADNRRRAEAYQRMAGELKDVEGRAASPDGVVSVVVGPGGEVRGITFGDQIDAVSPAALSATVMRTVAAARMAAARQQAEVVRRGLGDTGLLDKVLDSDERLFGDRRPRDPGPAPVAIRRPEPARDDEFFENFAALGDG
ncbi:MAG TPA: YbaB/EbfC family nucleoid-associated protein [Amycolatopsis sp.]|uniref:YbaB/EbfC family nucleoid-associated protein n=1 Tax=Amycolatopsis sp. TaxID=37632 RepID=UPI002B48C371|nr:YbaB/EbfC family nucleoid-associated protein [Amycolatopsis sp.]HKS43993.1 YbaB/EbfC family nucleoid-associated protein [Amycolatopsis sp.]